jgi:ribonuclease P protein component
MPDLGRKPDRLQCSQGFKFPKSARILRSEDFGVVLRSPSKGLCFRREIITLCALKTTEVGRVRIGLTVGKKNVPRAVDRVLTKRIMRENIRTALPLLREECLRGNFGLEVSLRVREPIRCTGVETKLSNEKIRIHNSTQACISSLIQKLRRIPREE